MQPRSFLTASGTHAGRPALPPFVGFGGGFERLDERDKTALQVGDLGLARGHLASLGLLLGAPSGAGPHSDVFFIAHIGQGGRRTGEGRGGLARRIEREQAFQRRRVAIALGERGEIEERAQRLGDRCVLVKGAVSNT